MLQILMALAGIYALVKGNIKITRNRQVSGSGGRALGALLLIGAAIPLFVAGGVLFMFGAFLVAIIIGLATSEPITKSA